MDIDAVRRENARYLAEKCGSKAAFAEKIGRSPGQVGHLIGKTPTKNIGRDLARHIETCFTLPKFWLDTDRSGQADATPLEPDREAFISMLAELTADEIIGAVEEIRPFLTPSDKLALAKVLISDVQSEIA